MCDRVFVEWASGSWLTSGYNPDFQADLAELVALHGPPTSVEFRAAGTGYAAPTPCEDCGLSFAKCRCDGYDPDPPASESVQLLQGLHDYYLGRYGHLLKKDEA